MLNGPKKVVQEEQNRFEVFELCLFMLTKCNQTMSMCYY